MRCGNGSSKVDPILDVSLQLRGKAEEDNTLAGCFRRWADSFFGDIPYFGIRELIKVCESGLLIRRI